MDVILPTESIATFVKRILYVREDVLRREIVDKWPKHALKIV